MNGAYGKLLECYESVRGRIPVRPRVALVLGSGLGGYGERMEVKEQISYGEIAGFPVSTVPGHEGRFLFGYVNGVPVVAMQGRVHYYEAVSYTHLTLPTT